MIFLPLIFEGKNRSIDNLTDMFFLSRHQNCLGKNYFELFGRMRRAGMIK